MAEAQLDALVIGGGVIGLAVARALAMQGMETIIAERAAHFGMETSSRNSEVIHAGIYYAPGSLKARLCVAGRDALYDFCDSHGVPYRRSGKFIVATRTEQVPALDAILNNARASGVEDLAWMDGAAVRAAEPDILCERAIFSPSTGIIDSHAYMTALLGEAEAHGAVLACATRIGAIRRIPEGWAVYLEGEDEPALTTRRVINCAGLWASEVARAVEGMDERDIPATRYAKGCYFSYSGSTRFRHLIYPVPEPGGLGTHLTLDMGGGARFGPDVEWIDTLDYEVSPDRHARFLGAVRAFWPGVDPERLQPAYSGIRPKISGPGEPAADFRFSGPDEHGAPGVFHLYGIESPGLTASLAIAAHVRDMVEAQS
ncbi:MAG: hypothetical protein RIS94_1189 [Pseudomonadota bacterium]|jgi:L-2-hydroxyglutarate oxidase LhgO